MKKATIKQTTTARLLATTLLASAGLAAVPAYAQDAAPAEEGDAIIVTGSRIATPNLTSNSPISVVSGQVFQDRGTINVESVINQLPQVTAGLNANVNNGGNGTVTVDVRGLGPERTLVLINGRRVVPSTNIGVVDLNIINPQLIDRVDVVTGGASATYGSDALGGVVNFILKRDFEGLELSGQYGSSTRGDSDQYTIGGIVGANIGDGRGNVTAAFSYSDRNPSFQSQRSFLRIDQNGGSATGIAGRFDQVPLNSFNIGGPFETIDPDSLRKIIAPVTFNKDGSIRPFINQLPETNDGVGDRFNFAPLNYIQTPQKRTTLNVLARYDITDAIEFYAEALYVNSRVDLQLAATPATNLLVDPNSPLLSASAKAAAATRPNPTAPLIFRRRLIEVGARQQSFKFNDYQITGGLRGSITGTLKFDLSYSFGRVESAQGIVNDVSRERLTAGLNGCPMGSPTGCVAVNAFGAGNISTAAANFIRISSAVDEFAFERKNLIGSITGELGDLGAGPIGFALGAEYREDSSTFTPSDPSQRGDILGFNAAMPINGKFDVGEIFGELRVPLLKDQPFAKSLTLDLAARYSDYSSVGGNETYRIGGDYQPIDQIRFRGLYSRAVRAPSVFELFQGGDQDFPFVTDPCFRIAPDGVTMRPAPSAAVSQVCILSGAADPRTAVLPQVNSQVEARNIGNVNLREETGDTYTFGAVLTPVKNLTFSVDYFDIKIKNFIARQFGGAQGLVAGCFNSGVTSAAQFAADPACQFVSRTASGELFLRIPLGNTSKLRTKGIDFALDYSLGLNALGLGDERLSVSANATYLIDYKFDGQEFAGFSTGDFGTLPRFKSNTRLTYRGGPASISLNWQFIGRAFDTGTESRIKAQSYFDLTGRVDVNKNFELFGGVLNILDNKPPLVLSGAGATNTDENLYDIVGARFFAGVKVKF